MNEGRTRALLLLLALGFVAVGAIFIPRFGIEVDEALVTNGIFPGGGPLYAWHVGSAEIPIMMMSYLGALKTWMYNAVFLVWAPGVWSMRLPTLLLAAVSLVLFFVLLDRTVSRRAAWIGVLLLATDPVYLLMNTIDYGPVTFQFVFKLWAMLLLVRFHRAGSVGALAGAFFLLGLAMWDKAIFAWVLAGLTLGAGGAFPGELRRHLGVRNLFIAAGAGIAGALPLIVFNIARPLETLRANAAPEALAVWGKSIILWHGIDGSVLAGFMTMLTPGPVTVEPSHWYQSLSVAIANGLGQPRQTLMLVASETAVLSLPLLWKTSARRPMLFALGVCIGTWLPMVLTAGAGAAAQHVLLLWPFHLMLIAVALDRVKWKMLPSGIAALLCLSNLVVVNQYYADVVVNGATMRWTDAMDPLHRWLADAKASRETSRIYVADWGIMETMVLLSEGRLPMEYVGTASDEVFRRALSTPGALFLAHAPEAVMHPNERAALEAAAAREHYTEEPVAVLRDRNGRPAFDLFRFRKLPL
jgi:hypothetical protein